MNHIKNTNAFIYGDYGSGKKQQIREELGISNNVEYEYLTILDSHMVAKNQKGIVSKSHKIKGAAASVGLLRIQKLAQKMQSPDLPAWWDNIDDWHELIKSLYLKDIKKLKKWIVANAN